MNALPWIYLAGPYSSDPCANTHRACNLWHRLQTRYRGRAVVICPHWSHFQNTITPMGYRDWIEYDLGLIRVLAGSTGCVFRMAGESPGAEQEVHFAGVLGIRVVGSEAELEGWLEGL